MWYITKGKTSEPEPDTHNVGGERYIQPANTGTHECHPHQYLQSTASASITTTKEKAIEEVNA